MKYGLLIAFMVVLSCIAISGCTQTGDILPLPSATPVGTPIPAETPAYTTVPSPVITPLPP